MRNSSRDRQNRYSNYNRGRQSRVKVKNTRSKIVGVSSSSKKKKKPQKAYRTDYSNMSLEELEKRKNIRAQKSKKRKIKKERRKKFGQGRPMIYLVFLFIIIYLGGYALSFLLRDSIPFDTVQYGSIDEPSTVRGIIVRNETLYTSNAAGIVVYNVTDNEKVKKGSTVCSIRDESVVKSLESDLDDINKSIITMQENREDLSLFSEDVKRVNSQIKEIVDENTYNFTVFNISQVYDMKSAVQKKLDSRNQMLLSENRGSLKELVEKKNTQEDMISKSILTLTAQTGGIVSYYTDGMETSLNISSIENLTKEQTLMETEISDIKTQVAAGDNVFKIVNGNEWYIAAYIPNSFIEEWEKGDNVFIYADGKNGSERLEANVYKLEQGESEAYVVLKITKDLLNYIDKRSVTFEISGSQVGLKIPVSAVAEQTILKIPVEYVKENTVIKVTETGTVNLAFSNSGSDEEGKFVYTPREDGILNIGDVIQNPDNISDKYTISDVINIKGVYIINTGIAEFKTLNMDGSSENSTHIIIDPELNPKIRLYDRIVTDIKNVQKEQMVYR